MGMNPFERTVIDVLRRSRRWLTTEEVANYGGMTWSTAKKYLKRLYWKKRVRRSKEGNKIYWRLRGR